MGSTVLNTMLDHRGFWLVGVGFLTGAFTFFVIGYFNGQSSKIHELSGNGSIPVQKQGLNGEGYDYSWAMDAVNKSQIREYLIELSLEPHMAGLERDEALAKWIETEWSEAGLDSVRLEGYNLLLDYPDKDMPNYVTVFDKSGEVVYKSHYKEEGVDDPNFVDAFNAYATNGLAEGLPVYVNFGTIEDFQYLKSEFGESLTQDKICLARYGAIYRGNKAENAYQFGCSGLVIFMDPSTVAQEGLDEENLLPNTFWMPGTAVQRGSLAMSDGDPLTPNWPSIDHAYRLDEKDRQKYLPKIPVQPIGYTDAEQILNKMAGEVAPSDWQGGLNITYMIGGEFTEGMVGSKVTVEVNNKLEQRVSSNVIGIIYGETEPDRYVMIGNHRDAWGFGAVDPSSGTAQLMEVVRVLAEKKKSGWRPRRTMMFLSWGAEEFSLCGSREFVEQYEIELRERAVTYLNTDICMVGPMLEPAASPTIADLIAGATKDVTSPNNDDESYYEFWKKWEGAGEDFTPEVSPFVGAGSDHASFLFYAGIPVMDLMFVEDKKLFPNIGLYPAYHTGFETFELVDRIYDPEFKIFRACSQLNLRLGLELAESEKLPITMENYADVMEDGMVTLEEEGILTKLEDLGIETEYWNKSVYAFREAANLFDKTAREQSVENAMALRVTNDQKRGFEKSFLLAEGLPDRIQYRHVITAPSLFDAYGGSAFPGVGDLLFSLEELEPTSEEYSRVVKQLRKHVSDLMIIVQRATDYLKPLPNYGETEDRNELNVRTSEKKKDQKEKHQVKFCRKCKQRLD